MESHESQRDQVSSVAQELGAGIRRDLRGRPNNVRVSNRSEGRRHVWRFQSGSDSAERFLYVAHAAMTRGGNPAADLLDQLKRAKWVDQLFGGTSTSFMLSPRGQLRPWSKD